MSQNPHSELLHEVTGDSESIYLLPRELTEQEGREIYVYENETDTIRKVLISNDVPCKLATDEETASIAVERSVEIGIPALAITYALYRDNKELIQTALEKIADCYIAKAQREVEVTIEQETADGEWKTFSFKGHPDDLDNVLSDIDESLNRDD